MNEEKSYQVVTAYFFAYKNGNLFKKFKVSKNELFVGNSINDDFNLEDSLITPKCAKIFLSEHKLFIENISKKSTITLNGKPVGSSKLKAKDELMIGETRLVLNYKFKSKTETSPITKDKNKITDIKAKSQNQESELVEIVELTKAKEEPNFLEIISADRKGEKIPITKNQFVIGKEGTDLVLNDKAISHKHAVLEIHDGKLFISDLFTEHGTYVNLEKIKKRLLYNGDIIRIGETKIKVNIDEDFYVKNEPERELSKKLIVREFKLRNTINLIGEKAYFETTEKRKKLTLPLFLVLLVLIFIIGFILYSNLQNTKNFPDQKKIEHILLQNIPETTQKIKQKTKINSNSNYDKKNNLEETLNEFGFEVNLDESGKKLNTQIEKKPKIQLKSIQNLSLIDIDVDISVDIKTKIVDKEFSKEKIESILRENSINIRPCFTENYKEIPSHIRLNFVINAGKINKINMLDEEILSRDLGSCIKTNLKKIYFPQKLDNIEVNYIYKIISKQKIEF
jgi:pSer/pThr/pTyr-binding forkhead associated (FHA) protein